MEKLERSIFEEVNGIEEDPILNEDPAAAAAGSGSRSLMPAIDLSFLRAKTGTGSIEEYIDHPMNFNKTKGMAQMIRGFTGLFGALDLAIIDIMVGFIQISKDKKGIAVNAY